MTVEELVTELSKHPSNLEVYTEGCDCWGDSGHVRITDDGEVLICRGSKEDWRDVVAKALAGDEHEQRIREKYPDFI